MNQPALTIEDRLPLAEGSSDSIPAFGDILTAYFVGGGEGIVMATNSPQELRAYDMQGELKWKYGRRGDGPGEFRRLVDVAPYRDDSLVALDAGRRRLLILSEKGGFGRDIRFEVPAEPTVNYDALLGGCGSGSFFLHGLVPHQVPEGPEVLTRLLAEFDETGLFKAVVLRIPGREMHYTITESGSLVWAHPPFGRDSYIACSKGRLVVAHGGEFGYRVYDLSGTLREIVRMPDRRIPVTERATEALLRQRFGNLPGPVQRRVMANQRKMIRHSMMPEVTGVFVDDRENVWLGEYTSPLEDGEGGHFTIFDDDGALRGRVGLPGSFQVTDAMQGLLLGLQASAYGIRRVAVYPLDAAPTSLDDTVH